MIVFQIIFFGLLAFELLVACFVKFNWCGFRDKLIKWIKDNDIENFIQGDYPNKWICQILFMIVLLALCIC